ncbi:MAG: hypothetical protein ABGZ24_25320 [Fuerstiella sp.]|jgi:hypothetical protein
MGQISKNRTQVYIVSQSGIAHVEAGSNKSPQIRKWILIPGLIAGFVFLITFMIVLLSGTGSSSSHEIFPGIPGLNFLDALEL